MKQVFVYRLLYYLPVLLNWFHDCGVKSLLCNIYTHQFQWFHGANYLNVRLLVLELV